MRLRYLPIVAAGLAACASPDAQHAQLPVAQQSLPQPPAAPPAPAPHPVPLARAAFPTAKPTPAQRLRKWVLQAPSVGQPLAADSGAHASSSPLAEVDSLAFGAAKAAQIFRVNPRRDTVLYGTEGTTIWVPGAAFAMARPDAPPVTEPVEIRLKEFYSLPDILLNNLSTNSSQGLLETGGMLHLEARTAIGGELCQLRPGTALLIRMPAARPQAAMQLFTGVRTAQHPLDWQRPQKALPISYFIGSGPKPGSQARQLPKILVRQLAYSAAMGRRLHESLSRSQRKALRRTQLTGKHLVAFGRVELAIDRRGQLVGATVTGIQDSTLASRIRQAVWQFPAFQPALLRGPTRPGPVSAAPRSYLVSVRKQHRAPAQPLPQLPVAGIWMFEIGFTREGRVWLPEPGRGAVAGPADMSKRPVFQAAAARRRLRQSGAQQLQSTSLDSLGGYLFSAANLGWANCDRFVNQTGPRVTVAVETVAPDAQVQLVFKRIRAVLPSYGRGHYDFAAIPAGEPATIVALKRENGLTYLATRAIRASNQPERNLEFRPVTPSELRTALAALE